MRLSNICLCLLVAGSVLPFALSAQAPGWIMERTNRSVFPDSPNAFCIYVSDINNDNYPDVVTVEGSSGTTTENTLRVYLNVQDTGSQTPATRMFVDVTAASGINAKPGTQDPSRGTSVVALADVNNDGNVDVVRGNYYHRLTTFVDQGDRCEVLLGNGQGHFTLVPGNGLHELGLVNPTGFSFLDYNKDGNVDLFIAPWSKDHDNNIWSSGYLMKGNGDGTFTYVSSQSGITQAEPMYGSAATDWNNDGWPDIATAPYCRTGGQLWKNNGDGTFTNVAVQAGYNAQYMSGDNGQPLCMWGSAPEDYDNDGDMDFFFNLVHGGSGANEGRSALARNGGVGDNYRLTPDRSLVVRKSPQSSHLGDYDAAWFDLDNDGMMDMAMTQGNYDAADRLYVFQQDQQHALVDVTSDLGLLLPGLKNLHRVEALDYDRDGDDDLILCRLGSVRSLHVLENNIGNTNNWIGISLRAPQGVNRSCVGARIYVWAGGVEHMREVYAGRGNAAGQQPFAMLFGIGSHTKVDSVKVAWPNKERSETTVRPPGINRYIEITASGLYVGDMDNAIKPAINLFPNPARDFILVQSNNYMLESIMIYDMLGRPVKQMHARDMAGGAVYCSTKELAPGQYILKGVGRDGRVIGQSFIKE